MSQPEPPIYSNALRVSTGAFDVLLEFGYQPPPTPGAPPPSPDDMQILARIVMSPAHAKTMIPLLAKLIANYEKQMGGPIPAPGFDDLGKE